MAGLIRQRVLAHYFGLTGVADAWSAAFRIPNLLQNLFGEGALSASFIPAYASLVARNDRAEADRLAGGVAAVLSAIVAVLVLIGVVAAPWLVDLIAPGFTGDRRPLTVLLVRVFFPGAGLLVLSAWCLGILNSHGRFFLSYTAPVVWNAAIVTALLLGGAEDPARLAVWGAWGAVVGAGLQVLVQLPSVLALSRGVRLRLRGHSRHLREVGRTFLPALLSRGVVQVSAYIDTLIASLLPIGAVSAVLNAQILYTLPVSLFGVSVAAAELPAMSAEAGHPDGEGEDTGRHRALRGRLEEAYGRLAYYVIPSAVAFLALGDVLAAAVFQSGVFSAEDARYVWLILAGASLGLLAATAGRLWSSAFFALRDTRTPLRFAIVRVTVTVVLGYLAAVVLPPRLGLDPLLGAVGLTLAGAVAGWVEFTLLFRALRVRLGPANLVESRRGVLLGSAVLAGGLGLGVVAISGLTHPILRALAATVTYGLGYGGLTVAAGVPEARVIARRLGIGRQR